MLMSVISHVLSAWFAFFLPVFGTWKALAHRPLSEPDVEKWGMYWTVVGAFVAFEYVAEWLVSWFPFYWEAKTVILLFLALPQTQGSTWVYQTYLHPFFSKNEAEIDAGIAAAQSNVLAFLQTRFAKLWDLVMGKLAQSQGVPGTSGVTEPAPGTPSTQQPPATDPIGLAKSLWGSYGSAAVGALQHYAQSAKSTAAPATGNGASQASAVTTGYDATPTRNQPASSPKPSPPADNPPPFPEPKLY